MNLSSTIYTKLHSLYCHCNHKQLATALTSLVLSYAFWCPGDLHLSNCKISNYPTATDCLQPALIFCSSQLTAQLVPILLSNSIPQTPYLLKLLCIKGLQPYNCAAHGQIIITHAQSDPLIPFAHFESQLHTPDIAIQLVTQKICRQQLAGAQEAIDSHSSVKGVQQIQTRE